MFTLFDYRAIAFGMLALGKTVYFWGISHAPSFKGRDPSSLNFGASVYTYAHTYV